MHDNDLLQEALFRKNRAFKKFAFLNLNEMAACVVKDKGLLIALKASMTIERKNKFSKKKHTNTAKGRYNSAASKCITSVAKLLRIQPLESIQDVLSNQKPSFVSHSCWMKREAGALYVNQNDVFYEAKLGFENKDWKENVMLKSFRVDEVNGKIGPISKVQHRNRAFVAAVAIFLRLGTIESTDRKIVPESCF